MPREDVERAISRAKHNVQAPVSARGMRATSQGEIAIATALLHLADVLGPTVQLSEVVADDLGYLRDDAEQRAAAALGAPPLPRLPREERGQ